jgi:hypothetical protein
MDARTISPSVSKKTTTCLLDSSNINNDFLSVPVMIRPLENSNLMHSTCQHVNRNNKNAAETSIFTDKTNEALSVCLFRR